MHEEYNREASKIVEQPKSKERIITKMKRPYAICMCCAVENIIFQYNFK